MSNVLQYHGVGRRKSGVARVWLRPGSGNWAGIFNTFFWVDPKEEVTAVMMTQAPSPARAFYRRLIKQLVYQAIAD